MFGAWPKLAWGVLAGFLCLALLPALAGQNPSRKRATKKPAAVETPAPPAAPLTLQQQPAVAPQVSCSEGRLTIVAENSNLGDILRDVRAQTGAAIDIPANATERVISHLGPGSPPEVLASLLKGSHFNYVILSSPTDSTKLVRVVLLPKSGGGENAVPANQEPTNSYAPPAQPMAQSQPSEEGADEAQTDEENDAAPEAQNPQQPPAQAPIKSPEQLLQELQRQQQSQQAPPGTPPGSQPNPPQQ